MPAVHDSLLERITTDPEVRFGKPCIRGHRITVQEILEWLSSGASQPANYLAIAEPPQPLVYLSLVQYYFPTAVLYVRTAGDPEAVMGAVRRQVQSLDRNLLLQTESLQTSIRELL